MPTELGKKASVLLLRAAALSLFIPRQWRVRQSAATPAGAPLIETSAALQAPVVETPPAPVENQAESRPAPEPARPPRRMWALVQTKPEALVLAVSASRAELERELSELNETWNHWELRVERQRYAIQPAPVLYAAQDAAPTAGAKARTEG